MIELKDLLSRFDRIISSGEGEKESIRRAVAQATGIPIEKGQIDIKNKVIYPDIKPIYKNEILLKREKIFSELQKDLGEKAPEELR